MDAIERMRVLDSKASSRGAKEKEREDQALEEWDGEEKADWEVAGGVPGYPPTGGLGRGYSTLRRIGQVRGGEWGLGSGGKKKPSSLRNQEIY